MKFAPRLKKQIKLIGGLVIVAATIAIFAWYITENPAIGQQLRATSLWTVLSIIALYGIWLLALMGVLAGSLHIYRKRMGLEENFLLNSYSSVVNFFGPGQSGPAMRGAYLKLKHGVRIKQYIYATLIYYAFYAILSGIILAATALPWWLTVLGTLAIAGVSVLVLRFFHRRNQRQIDQSEKQGSTTLRPYLFIAAAAALQVAVLVAIYYLELRSLDASVSLGQVLSYTGAANMALFVAITPGAIGFREAFLVFSQELHGISNDLIVAANVLDRAVYVVFLSLLCVAIFGLHAQKKLGLKAMQRASGKSATIE
jgi:uncharacterized membrane protein YbhN (UPF0104 family)